MPRRISFAPVPGGGRHGMAVWKEPPMRKRFLSSVATALVGAGSALAQSPYYLPTDRPAQTGGAPALLSADQTAPAAPGRVVAPPHMGCGSAGLVCRMHGLPPSVPSQARVYGGLSYMPMRV